MQFKVQPNFLTITCHYKYHNRKGKSSLYLQIKYHTKYNDLNKNKKRNIQQFTS